MANQNTQLEVRLAWLAFAGPIVAGALAIGGVYIGSSMQSDAAREVNRSQSTQASAQYLRDQRREAYIRLLTTNRALLTAAQDVLQPDPDLPGTVTERRAASRLARRDYLLAVDVVRVVGPTGLLGEIAELTAAHFQARDRINALRRHPERQEADKEASAKAIAHIYALTKELAPRLQEVIEANQ